MTENYLLGGTVCLLIAVLAFLGMWLSWRKRAKRGIELAVQLQPLTGRFLAEYETFYVVTHETAQQLHRVSLPGLIYRGNAGVKVYTDGIEIAVQGEDAVPLAQITAVETGSSSLAKTVEKNGLVRVRWSLAGVDLQSVLRFSDPQIQTEFIKQVKAEILQEETGQC